MGLPPSGLSYSGAYEMSQVAKAFGLGPLAFERLPIPDREYMIAFWRTEQMIAAALEFRASRKPVPQ